MPANNSYVFDEGETSLNTLCTLKEVYGNLTIELESAMVEGSFILPLGFQASEYANELIVLRRRTPVLR